MHVMFRNSRQFAQSTRIMKSTLHAALLVMLSAVCPSLNVAFGQSATTGAITGVVSDTNGALLPAATVTVKSVDTSATRSVKTNAAGEYRVPELEPGTYTAVFTSDGFETYQESAITVTVGSLSNVSPKLKVGSVSDKVEVTDQTSMMHTEDSSISSTIDQNAIDNLPINGRRWSNFALLTPGVVSNSDGFGLLSFRGISFLLNNSTVDGADDNQAYFSEQRGRTRASYSVSQAAVQEFQVNLSNYSAEYGRAAGGVINTVTKSGGNSFHGELFFYDRDNNLGATNPYTLLTTQIPNSNAFQTYVYKPKDWRKQWGFGAGGPLLRNKLFWFYSYDQSQRNFPGTARASDPADTFAASDSVLPSGATCTNGTFSAGTASVAPGDTYACAEANALGVNYQGGSAYYQQGLGIISSFLGTVPRTASQVLNFPKLDWQINDRNRLTLQYNRLRYSSPAGVETQASNFYGRASFGNDFVKEDFGIARLASVLNSSLVNSFLFQYGRDFEYESSQTPTPNEQPISTTIPSDPLAPSAPPSIQIGYEFDGTGFDIGRVYFLERRALPNERRIQGLDMVTWSHGRHTTKAGVEVNRVFDYVDNLYEEGGSYSYDYNWDFIADYLHATTGVGGANYKQQYYSFSQGFGNPRMSLATTDYAGFLTDDWRLTPRLTLTLGVRYEYEYIPPNPIPNTGGAIGTGGGPVPQTANQPDDRNNVGPRVGFAYNVYGNGRTTLRGGYGIYYGRIINSNILQTYLLSGGVGSQVALTANGSNSCLAFPSIFASAAGYEAACGNYSSTIAYLDKHLQNPQVHEFDLAVEQDLGWNTVFSLSYMGSLGRELAAAVDQSVAPATSTATFQVLNNPTPPAPGYVTYPHGGKSLPLLANSMHTYTKYTATNGLFPNYYHVLDFKSEVNSSYNALVMQLNHNFKDNFSFLSNYTWSHALDYNPYLSTGYGSASELLDPLNPQLEHANSSLNVPNRFVAAATYRTNINNLSGWKKYSFNGWGIAPIVQMQAGLPYSAGTSGSVSNSLYGGIIGSGGAARIPDLGRNIFTMPKTATVDLRISKTFRLGPGDSRYRLEVLGEAFNLFNHQNITSVNTEAYCITTSPSTSAPSTGVACPQIQSLPPTTSSQYLVGNPLFGTNNNSNSNTLLTPRQMQIAGRFYF
jgi:Carboxypeptidase regulatory-like domain/TonB dependent receptor